jgi:hypothetical protein
LSVVSENPAMTNYLAYHNPERMQIPGLEVRDLCVLTNHPGKCERGDRVWMITGEEHPRRYYLRLYFTVKTVTKSAQTEFSFEVSGNDGRFFDPMPCLDSETWFPELLRKMANFSLGFQPINNAEVARGFEVVAGIAASGASAQ